MAIQADHLTDVERGQRVLRAEAAALEAAASAIGSDFGRAVELLLLCANDGGTVLVTGLGKSGHVGAKIAATLSSLGVPAHAVHPVEAAHGDLGRFRPTDVAICLSHSGETDEVCGLAAILRQDAIPVIAITRARPDGPSTLERLALVTLDDAVDTEAGAAIDTPLLAPTSSTASAMAIGDALALTVATRMRFTNEQFARRHPGGQLGGLLRPVVELLRFRVGENLPVIHADETVRDALDDAAGASRRPGAILIADRATGVLDGIFTDGDLRRLVRRDITALDRPIGDVMTRRPRTLPDTALARDAASMIREHRQDEIPVVDDRGRPVGLLDVQDLIAMRLVRDDTARAT
ncbi:MAG: KpsF/GutQ family sugar-phosphate isomerase [Planctomycetota bacterium]